MDFLSFQGRPLECRQRGSAELIGIIQEGDPLDMRSKVEPWNEYRRFEQQLDATIEKGLKWPGEMMTLIEVKTLYEKDFALWVEETVNQLKAGDFSQVDLENLIDEVESLGKRDKRELENRLTTLFEHALKRCYVTLPECYAGWENTLKRTQKELKKILRDSPSLKQYFLEVKGDCYRDGVDNIKDEYGDIFPENYPFPDQVDEMLNDKFWENLS